MTAEQVGDGPVPAVGNNSSMAHVPINHPLRPVYRALTGLAAVYLLIFGVVGFLQTSDLATFEQHGLPSVLGLPANRASAIFSLGVGAAVLAGVLIGRNLDVAIDLVVGSVLLVVGTAMMGLMRTDANAFGYSMANCVVVYVIGMLALPAGLYGKVGSAASARAEDSFRHTH